MDKRSLLFVALVSLMFFLVNIFFTYQDQEKNKEWQDQYEAKKAKQHQKLVADINDRTAKAEELPLVQLYLDSEGKEEITEGIQTGDHTILLAWTNSLPTTLYSRQIDKNNNQGKLEQLTLRYAPAFSGLPAVYSSSTADTSKPFTIGNLPDLGRFDIQLVIPYLRNPEMPFEIELGEFIDGHFIRPNEKIEKSAVSPSKKSIEKGNALVLFKTSKGYLPVGVYDVSRNKIRSFEEFDYLAKHFTVAQDKVLSKEAAGEKFYVLENGYQQLVFSNRGAALLEINLPFKSDNHPNSVIREIEFDRDMVKDHPYDTYFPQHPYYTPTNDKNNPFEEHSKGQLGGYYPLLRRDLVEVPPRKSVRIHPSYYAFNIVSEYPEVAELVYEVKEFDSKHIVFEANQQHRRITKTYSFEENEKAAPYIINLSVKVEGDSRGLWITSGIPEAEWMVGASTPSLKYHMTRNKKSEVETIDPPKDSLVVTSITPDWVSTSNGFLGMIMDPLSDIDSGYKAVRVEGTVVPSRIVEIGEDYDRFKAADLPGYMMLLPLKNSGGTMNFRLFAGPFAEDVLKTIDRTFSDPDTGYNPQYIDSQSFQGWFSFISEPFAKFLLIIMKFFHSFTGSWALSIILLTVVLRLMLYPLNAWSMKSMLKMQQIAPEVTAIQERNKKDTKKAQMEIMNLYRERGINPMTGCLPLLIQMPFLIGMFDLLKSTFELRGACFIPGWIDDLSAPDVVFSWNYPIFFIGTEFHLLPFLLGGVMFIQQRYMSATPVDPKNLTDQQKQQRMMGNMMTVVFTLMFYNFPSGLNLYWLSSMTLGIVQQWYTARQLKKQPIVIQPTIVKKKRDEIKGIT